MGLLTFSINVTLDGCVDHQEGIADDETHTFFTRLMDEGGAMLWRPGRPEQHSTPCLDILLRRTTADNETSGGQRRPANRLRSGGQTECSKC
jgi:hypothetical protein